MKYFLDTEFSDNGDRIIPLSIGIVNENGSELYCEFPYDPRKLQPWVKANVVPHLTGQIATWDSARRRIVEFVGEEPEFWGYYCDYDWVMLCQLYGAMTSLPKTWPLWCRDLKQLLDDMGNPGYSSSEGHNALVDARWIREVYNDLLESAGIGNVGDEPF